MNFDDGFNVNLDPNYEVILLENLFSKSPSNDEINKLFEPILDIVVTPNLEFMFDEFIILDFNEGYYKSSLGKAPFIVSQSDFQFENEKFIFIMNIENN